MRTVAAQNARFFHRFLSPFAVSVIKVFRDAEIALIVEITITLLSVINVGIFVAIRSSYTFTVPETILREIYLGFQIFIYIFVYR